MKQLGHVEDSAWRIWETKTGTMYSWSSPLTVTTLAVEGEGSFCSVLSADTHPPILMVEDERERERDIETIRVK